MFSAEDVVEFGERCKGKQDLSFAKRQIKGLARF